MAKTVELVITADIRPFMRAMRRAVLAARNVNRARRGLPKIVRPLVADRGDHTSSITDAGAR